jgi:hypothetical protein
MEQIIKETILKISKNIPIIPSPTNLAPELNELKFSFPFTFIEKGRKMSLIKYQFTRTLKINSQPTQTPVASKPVVLTR